MNMKKNILIFAVCAFTFFSCTNGDDLIENPKISNGETISNSETYPPQVFAKQLAISLKNNDNLRDFLKEEANKQKDGDYDILIAESIDQEVKTESMLRSVDASGVTPTFRETINKNGEITSALTEIENDYPLLQISIPNMENASWESVVSGEAPFYVAFLPSDYEEGDDVLAYDQNGNEHILDGKNEPETPVIVIGTNERIACAPTLADRNEYMNVYFKDENRTYYLGYENNEVKTDNLSLRSAFTPVIWKAAFASQSAMRQYEPWTKGRPEVAVSVANGHAHHDHEFDNTGWWDANENVLNYSPGLSFETYGSSTEFYAMYYGWWELDYTFSVTDKPQTVPVYNSNGIAFSLIIFIGWLGDSNDFIGETLVNNHYHTVGKKYETVNGKHGSGDFYFWLN
jgi:hypothetical protein